MRLSPSRQLTDGFDSGSTHTSNQTADALNRAEASLYAIRYKSDLGSSFAPDLYRLILDTAGIRFHRPDGDYQPIVSHLETDLRHRYVLGFRGERVSGKTRHEVRIEVMRRNPTVRASNTYSRDSLQWRASPGRM